VARLDSGVKLPSVPVVVDDITASNRLLALASLPSARCWLSPSAEPDIADVPAIPTSCHVSPWPDSPATATSARISPPAPRNACSPNPPATVLDRFPPNDVTFATAPPAAPYRPDMPASFQSTPVLLPSDTW
jgi:hypothetical protein